MYALLFFFFLMIRRPPRSTLFPYTRSSDLTPADYTRDPTRWGSVEMAAHFPGFKHLDMRTSGAVIRLRHGGAGPPPVAYPNRRAADCTSLTHPTQRSPSCLHNTIDSASVSD